MKFGKIIWKIFVWLFKLALKLFTLLLWASLSITEVILHHINENLKKLSAHK